MGFDWMENIANFQRDMRRGHRIDIEIAMMTPAHNIYCEILASERPNMRYMAQFRSQGLDSCGLPCGALRLGTLAPLQRDLQGFSERPAKFVMTSGL